MCGAVGLTATWTCSLRRRHGGRRLEPKVGDISARRPGSSERQGDVDKGPGGCARDGDTSRGRKRRPPRAPPGSLGTAAYIDQGRACGPGAHAAIHHAPGTYERRPRARADAAGPGALVRGEVRYKARREARVCIRAHDSHAPGLGCLRGSACHSSSSEGGEGRLRLCIRQSVGRMDRAVAVVTTHGGVLRRRAPECIRKESAEEVPPTTPRAPFPAPIRCRRVEGHGPHCDGHLGRLSDLEQRVRGRVHGSECSQRRVVSLTLGTQVIVLPRRGARSGVHLPGSGSRSPLTSHTEHFQRVPTIGDLRQLSQAMPLWTGRSLAGAGTCKRGAPGAGVNHQGWLASWSCAPPRA